MVKQVLFQSEQLILHVKEDDRKDADDENQGEKQNNRDVDPPIAYGRWRVIFVQAVIRLFRL